jgi:hypothetical protein
LGDVHVEDLGITLQELTGTGTTFQMRSAYSWMDRSLLKNPQ